MDRFECIGTLGIRNHCRNSGKAQEFHAHVCGCIDGGFSKEVCSSDL